MSVSVGDLRATLDLETSKFVKGAGDAEHSFGSMKRAFEIFAGFSLAHVFEEAVRGIKDFVVESIKLGFQAKLVEHAFEAMAGSVGANAHALEAALLRASGNVVDTSNVMRAAARALQQGLDPADTVRLMEIARSQSILTGQTVQDAFNSVTEAIANQQTRALKYMGIVIDVDKAVTDYATQHGRLTKELTETGRAQAILQAVFKATEGKLLDTNNETVRMKEAVERTAAQWENLKEDIGKALIGAIIPVTEYIKSELVPALTKSQENFMRCGQHCKYRISSIVIW